MKIKSIAAICKKNKNIAIFERYSDDGDILTQYIGDGSAVYPVIGLPPLDAESLLTIFDVPEKDRDNYFVKTLAFRRVSASRIPTRRKDKSSGKEYQSSIPDEP